MSEQAIAATLESGKLTAEQVHEAVYEHSIHADCADADWQAIADELNAIGGGECERVKRGTKPDGTPRWRCSICDYGLGDNRWSYCPKCGASGRR